MWYNITNVNMSGIVPMVQTTNSVFLFHMFGNVILLVVFFVCFRSFTFFNNNPRTNIMYSMLIMAVLSILLNLLSLVPTATVFICWLAFAVATVVAMILGE